MRATSVLRILLGLNRTIVRSFEFREFGIVIDVTPSTRVARCGRCGGKVRSGYDARSRTWRHLDFAGMEVRLRYAIRRVNCRRCGVTTELVPWAGPAGKFTYDFEDTVALLAQKTDKTTVSDFMGIAWETVGAICQRVVERRGSDDLLEGLTHVGIDEISYKKHHHYLTVVTDLKRRRVVWIGVGRSGDTLRGFFDALGGARGGALRTVCIDMAQGYIQAVRACAPQAKIVFDRFHVQRMAHDALDKVRREQVRERADTDNGRAIKRTRWALQKNPWNLTLGEHEKLTAVKLHNRPLYRAYLLKETLCDILDHRQPNVARDRLDEWMAWAQRSRLAPFAKLAATIRKYLDGILEYVRTRLSNGLSEGLNGKIRTITKRAYGFRDPHSLIAMIHLCCTGITIPLVRHYPATRA
jgi:transposase